MAPCVTHDLISYYGEVLASEILEWTDVAQLYGAHRMLHRVILCNGVLSAALLPRNVCIALLKKRVTLPRGIENEIGLVGSMCVTVILFASLASHGPGEVCPEVQSNVHHVNASRDDGLSNLPLGLAFHRPPPSRGRK